MGARDCLAGSLLASEGRGSLEREAFAETGANSHPAGIRQVEAVVPMAKKDDEGLQRRVGWHHTTRRRKQARDAVAVGCGQQLHTQAYEGMREALARETPKRSGIHESQTHSQSR